MESRRESWEIFRIKNWKNVTDGLSGVEREAQRPGVGGRVGRHQVRNDAGSSFGWLQCGGPVPSREVSSWQRALGDIFACRRTWKRAFRESGLARREEGRLHLKVAQFESAHF